MSAAGPLETLGNLVHLLAARSELQDTDEKKHDDLCEAVQYLGQMADILDSMIERLPC